MASEGWRGVDRQNRCPVCEGYDNCTISIDGCAVWCGRVRSGSVRENGGGQFLHFLKDRANWKQDELERADIAAKSRDRKSRGRTDPPKDWPKIARECFEHPQAGNEREKLAAELGVSAGALLRLECGFTKYGRKEAWTFPERDAAGSVIGIGMRFRDGQKRLLQGGKRGLIFAPDWLLDSGTIYLPEGPSDVAALLTVGCCAVGRPSNTGGLGLLTGLLGKYASKRELVVFGENDRKQHDELKERVREKHNRNCSGCRQCWPGQVAREIAQKLADQLSCDVDVYFPDESIGKDVRAVLSYLQNLEVA